MNKAQREQRARKHERVRRQRYGVPKPKEYGVLARDVRHDDKGCGSGILAGTRVEVVRREGDRVVVAGAGFRYSCNPAKPPLADNHVVLRIPQEALNDGSKEVQSSC